MCVYGLLYVMLFFFFNDTATTEIYTLSLHDALPIYARRQRAGDSPGSGFVGGLCRGDRKSTRLNSSHANISYAVFCLKKTQHKTTLNPLLHLTLGQYMGLWAEVTF